LFMVHLEGAPMSRERLIVALDHSTAEAALRQVDALGDLVQRYKVGLELYLAAGRAFVAELVRRDKRVFLDLKLHDIPETVRRAAAVAARQGVELLTVHAGGGKAMLEAAVAGAGDTKILAVTVLTSLDLADLHADGSAVASAEELVVRRALLAHAAGCTGVVASPLEARAVRQAVGPSLLIVTPGVRFATGEDAARPSDQKRVATAAAARAAGADAVVVGRPIRDAADPRLAVEYLLRELS
jgi:orotidine-5'-phosphate decarboxylase